MLGHKKSHYPQYYRKALNPQNKRELEWIKTPNVKLHYRYIYPTLDKH